MSAKRESRAERQARWAKEAEQWEASGLAGGNMIEIGALARGLRGRHSYEVHMTGDTDWLFRDEPDEVPLVVRIFAFVPRDEAGGA